MRCVYLIKHDVLRKLILALVFVSMAPSFVAVADSTHDSSTDKTQKRRPRIAPYCEKRTNKKNVLDVLFNNSTGNTVNFNQLFPNSEDQEFPLGRSPESKDRKSLAPFNPQTTLSFFEQLIRCESPSLYKLSVLESLQETCSEQNSSIGVQNQKIVCELVQAFGVLNALPADFNLSLADQVQQFMKMGSIEAEPLSSILKNIDKIRSENTSSTDLELLRALLFGKMFGGFMGAIDFFVGPDVAEALRQRFLLGPPSAADKNSASFLPSNSKYFLNQNPPPHKDNPAIQEWMKGLSNLLNQREQSPEKATQAFSQLKSAIGKLDSLSPQEHAQFRRWALERLVETQSGQISSSSSAPHQNVFSSLQHSLINTLKRLDTISSDSGDEQVNSGYPALLMEESKLNHALSPSEKKELDELEYFFKNSHKSSLNSMSRIALMSLTEQQRHFLLELTKHPSASQDTHLKFWLTEPNPKWISQAQQLLSDKDSSSRYLANLSERFSEEVLGHPLPITSKIRLLALDHDSREKLNRLMGILKKDDPNTHSLMERLLKNGSASEIEAASQLYDSAFHQYSTHFKQSRLRERFISDLVSNGKLTGESERELDLLIQDIAQSESNGKTSSELKQQFLERLKEEASFKKKHGGALRDFADTLTGKISSSSSHTTNDWRAALVRKPPSALSESEKKALSLFKENDHLAETFRKTQQRLSEELHRWSRALERSTSETDQQKATQKIQELGKVAKEEQARFLKLIQENELIVSSLKQNQDLPIVERAYEFMEQHQVSPEMADIVFSQLSELMGRNQRRDRLFQASMGQSSGAFKPATDAARNLFAQEEHSVRELYSKAENTLPAGWLEAQNTASEQKKQRDSKRKLVFDQLAEFGVKTQAGSEQLDFSQVNLVNKNLDRFKSLLSEYRKTVGSNELDAPDFWDVFQGQLETLYSGSDHSNVFAFNESMAIRAKRIPLSDQKEPWNEGGLDRVEFEFVDGKQLSAELKEKSAALKTNLDRRLSLIKSTTSTINGLSVAMEDVPRAFIKSWTGLDISKYYQPYGLATQLHGIEWGPEGPTTYTQRMLERDLNQEIKLIQDLRKLGNLPVDYVVPGQKTVKIPAYQYADLMENRAVLLDRFHGQELNSLLRDLDYTIAGMELGQEAGIAAGVTLATMGMGTAISGTGLALKIGRAASLLNSAVGGSRLALQAAAVAQRASPLAMRTLQYGRGLGTMSLRGVTGYASGIGLASIKDSAVRSWEMNRALQTDWKGALEKGNPIQFPHYLDENENGIPDGAEGKWTSPTDFMPRLSEFAEGSFETATTFGMMSPLSAGFEKVLPAGPRILGIPVSKLVAPVLGLSSATVVKDQVISNHLLMRDRNGDGKVDESDQISWSDTGWQALTNLGYSAPLDELGIAFLAQSRLPLLRNFRNFSPTTQASIGRLIGWELNQELSGGVAVGQYYLGRDAQQDADGDGKPDGGFVSMTGQKANSAWDAYFTGRFESLYQDYLAGSGAFHRAHGIGMAAAALKDPNFGKAYLDKLNGNNRFQQLRQDFLSSISLSDLKIDSSTLGVGHQQLLRNAASQEGIDADQFVLLFFNGPIKENIKVNLCVTQYCISKG
ncbi:MAG: hypothetical protein EBQ85_10535 [Proteobacteria bacterium]|nr:hypothetical protein [Pseudomonadota bacterium]